MKTDVDWKSEDTRAGLSVAWSQGMALAVALTLAGCATQGPQPPNLGLLKQELRVYAEGGAYQHDLKVVAGRARSWIEERATRGGDKLTVVFDIDETLLSNWPHMAAMDFGYVKAEWNKWVDEAKAPAIEPVREVFRISRQLGIDVVIITSRTERDRAGTMRNLQAIGCDDYQALVFKPEGDPRSSAEFKTAERQLFVAEGRKIIANIGDQKSDLTGGFAEKSFKLPNVFYISP